MFRLFSSFFGGQPANEPARSKLADGLEKLFMFCVDKDLDIGPAYAKFIRVISDSRGWNLFSQNTITYEDINQGIGVLERAFPPGSPASFKHLYLIIRVAFFFEQESERIKNNTRLLAPLMNYLAQTYGTGVYSEQLDKGVNMIFTHFDRDYFLDMLDLTIGHITSGIAGKYISASKIYYEVFLMSFMLALYTNKSDSKALALTGRFETRVVEAWNIFLMRKAYTGTLVPQNVPHEIVLGAYKKYDYQLALTVSYVFEYYPRIDNPAASFSRRLKSVMCSKDFSDPELLVSWWCTFRLLCVFTDYSRCYKDVFFHLCKTLLASSSKIPLEGAQAYVPKLFGVMKQFVKGFRKAVENMEQNFIETICDYIREDYANVSFDTFHELSHSSSKAVRARLGATFLEVLKSYLETQTTVSSEKLGVLFDDYFSKDISDPLEPFAKWISLYRRRETTYQQIIDFMFFPLDCPKYTKNFEAKLVAEGKDSDVFKKFWDVLLDADLNYRSLFNTLSIAYYIKKEAKYNNSGKDNMFVLFLIDSFASTAVKVQLGKDPSMKRIEETCAALGRMYVASKAPTLLLMLLFEYTAEEILVNKKRKHTQIVQIKLIQSWNAEDFAPSFRDRFEKYVRTVEAIRDKLSAEIVSTLDGTITYKDFNKLSKVSKEFDKMCEEWSIEGVDVSELSRKLVTAFRLRDNIKRYTDMLTKLSYNIQPVPTIDFGTKTINEICAEAESLNERLHERDPSSCAILDSMLRLIEKNSTLFLRTFERVTREALKDKEVPYDLKYVDFVYRATRDEFKKYLNADKAQLSDLIKLRDMAEGAKSNFDEEIEFM